MIADYVGRASEFYILVEREEEDYEGLGQDNWVPILLSLLQSDIVNDRCVQLHDYLLNKSSKHMLWALVKRALSRTLLLLLLGVLNCACGGDPGISSPLLASSIATRCILTVSSCLRLATLTLLLL